MKQLEKLIPTFSVKHVAVMSHFYAEGVVASDSPQQHIKTMLMWAAVYLAQSHVHI